MPREFPRTVLEFEHRFRTEEACGAYLAGIRWVDGFRCPRCENAKAWKRTRGQYQCTGCSTEVSVTAGTVFHRSKVPLRLWFRAIWWLTNQKSGINAMSLQRLLGLGSYQTAWTMLHKLRRAMVRPDRELLSGHVEIDETLVGGHRKRPYSRYSKKTVIIAAEVRGNGIGRIRLETIPNDRLGHLLSFARRNVVAGSEIRTDGAWAYQHLTKLGYRHSATALRNKPDEESIRALPRAHRIASLLKRWLLGTYQGRASPAQLEHYLQEFTFRFNRRLSPTRGQLFYRLIQQCVVRAPTPYKAITGSV